MAREKCVYCGAALSPETLREAAAAAKRVFQSTTLMGLEDAARGVGGGPHDRRYLVIDTAANALETLAAACSISTWEARQWQAASRYRLLRVTAEPQDGPYETRLRGMGVTVHAIAENAVARARNPLPIESLDASKVPAECTLRPDPDSPPIRSHLEEGQVAVIVSGPIRREKVKEIASFKKVPSVRLEDAFLVHFHIRGETRPWEIDARRTSFEGEGLASAHMRTLQLVRRLALKVAHDEAFRNVVPALSEGVDPLTEIASGSSTGGSSSKGTKLIVLDNVAQFREYSAWRGRLAVDGPEATRGAELNQGI
jgi:hypothetical protein